MNIVLREKDPHIKAKIQEENIIRLRIIFIIPIITSVFTLIWSVHFRTLAGNVVLPYYPLIALCLLTVLYALLYLPFIKGKQWFPIVLVIIWVFNILLEVVQPMNGMDLLRFIMNLFLINLFLFTPPLTLICINTAAFAGILNRLVLSPSPHNPFFEDLNTETTILFVFVMVVIFASLTVMSIHEYFDTASRIRREKTVRTQRDELERMAKLRDHIDRIIRHDLKNPLNGIIGMSELLGMEESLTDEQRDMAAVIRQSGYTLLHLINDSLDFFKMEEGTYELKPERIVLSDLMNAVLQEFNNNSGGSNAAVKVVYNTDSIGPDKRALFEIVGEKPKIHSMFSNLIKNAAEASPDGETVTVYITAEEEGVLVDIHNKGTVPEEVRDRFFERYVTSGKKHGTGLGTYSAALIAKYHNADIRFTTDEPEGTHVFVQFPINSTLST